MATSPLDLARLIGAELEIAERSVRAVVDLLQTGNTVPFVARYRKEATGGLDEVQIRRIQERNAYLGELEKRRHAVLTAIAEQNQLDEAIRRQVFACRTKAELEDLYLPYKSQRRTRATIAREKGLEPLANRIRSLPAGGTPDAEAQRFVDPDQGIDDVDAALQGARDIIAQRIAEDVEIRSQVRQSLWAGVITARVNPKKRELGRKFEPYFDFREPVRRIASHRYMAIRRGEREGVLRVSIDGDTPALLSRLGQRLRVRSASAFAAQLRAALEDAVRRLLLPSMETEVHAELKKAADESAIAVFAENLEKLLLAPPLGEEPVMGIDPGFRTGCKCAVLDRTGKLLQHTTIHPFSGDAAETRARHTLIELTKNHGPRAIAIGNGTAGRETTAFVRGVLQQAGLGDVTVVSVNESGASVYSASEGARAEFPRLDLTVRGAISIGRRLQDPLAELVKIDPKAIGVGQYQHDVHPPRLKRKLVEVVESCVNRVGVELNTASVPLLSHVAGIGAGLAHKIVNHRDRQGPFASRDSLRGVSGLGPRAYEQCAGFLRIRGGTQPLDASAVHPERYGLVARMAADLDVEIGELLGNSTLSGRIVLSRYTGDDVGEPTLLDILDELRRPGRDPRASFEPPKFRDDVTTPQDLRTGMTLEGIVTNVTAFGAFVDIGVHLDGLVHISQLADRFVRDPHEIVEVGQRLDVTVLAVDTERQRISLSAREPDDRSGGP